MAATHLAVREARRLSPAPTPLHVVGFSNGGALAMKYALDALDDKALARPEHIVLFAPMIGITSTARFAGVFGWPALMPAFDKAAWLGIVPEFNPFKYNSFPVNGARQSSLVARRLQAQIDRHAREDNLKGLAPVLTFQSVVDFTVSTRAIVAALYAKLPANGSELVLFDLNRNAKFGPLLRRSTDTVLERLLPDAPRNFRTTVITNADRGTDNVVARTIEAGATTEQITDLGLAFPPGVFSLSHLAIPFPLNDPLYGMEPDISEDYGANLGAMATRGERGILVVSIDSLARMSSNPFFDSCCSASTKVSACPPSPKPERPCWTLRRRLLAGRLRCWVLCAAGLAQAAEATLLQNVRIFDGKSASLSGPSHVLVRGEHHRAHLGGADRAAARRHRHRRPGAHADARADRQPLAHDVRRAVDGPSCWRATSAT